MGEEEEGCGQELRGRGSGGQYSEGRELSLCVKGEGQNREESSAFANLLSLVVTERDGLNVTIDNSTTSEGRG